MHIPEYTIRGVSADYSHKEILTPITSNCRCNNSSDWATLAFESFKGNTSNKIAAAFARTLGLATCAK